MGTTKVDLTRRQLVNLLVGAYQAGVDSVLDLVKDCTPKKERVRELFEKKFGLVTEQGEYKADDK